MKLKVVTITGADDSIDPHELAKLSQEFPFVEWAILLSKKQMGNKRFPSTEWMTELKKDADKLQLAGHLCGSWLRVNLMNFGDIEFTKEIPLWDDFQRIQLNFHAEKTDLSEEALKALRNQTWHKKKQFIVQMDGVNNDLYKNLLFAGVLTSGLFDTSHGAGVLPSTGWPDVIPSINPHTYRGYAGGLSPDNIEEQLIKLESAVGDDLVWVDMETKVRSHNDMQFDLNKVRTCLEIAKKWT
jgi:hypothetical protein